MTCIYYNISMEDFKFGLVTVLGIGVIGLIGFWAFRTLDPGDLHEARQEQKKLVEENEELKEEVAKLKSELLALAPAPETEKPTPTEQKPQTPEPTPVPPPKTTTTYKHQSLINELQGLVNDNVVMKEGSQGTRVGTIQKFFNLYFKTSDRIDNDFGAGTKTDVINFQKAEKLQADGQTGPSTYRKMIDWLKKQG
jgi:hypothetical protein